MCSSAIEFTKEESPEAKSIMDAKSIVMLLVSAGLMVYLLYALLRPEKF
jgi:K+-transporting ATPase KdpF subunit